MIRLNYGELPTREQFEREYATRLGPDEYEIRHGTPTRAGTIRPAEGLYTCSQLWEELENLWHMNCFESLGWASDILYTLGFEWI